MQLPQDKKERQKMLGLIGLGIAGAVYGLWALVYQPIQAKRVMAMEQIAELENKLENAERQIRRIPQLERDLGVVLSNLLVRSETQLLEPRLGNYLLPVRELLGKHAAALEIDPPQIDEIGLVQVPKVANASASPTIQLYAVRVTASCGYEALRQWFLAVENENPLVGFGNVMITARSENPLHHQVTFEVHLPTWLQTGYEGLMREDTAMLADKEKP